MVLKFYLSIENRMHQAKKNVNCFDVLFMISQVLYSLLNKVEIFRIFLMVLKFFLSIENRMHQAKKKVNCFDVFL